jgi:LacI family transcriptional regulator
MSTLRVAELFGSLANAPSIRSLAQALKLAPATVSDALRGTGRVSPDTAKRVRTGARALGYRANPLTATVLSQIRRNKSSLHRGTIATIDLFEPTHWPHGPFPRELVAGARARVQEMGFSVEEFVVGAPGLSMQRLDGVLKSRGIRGILVLPSWSRPDLSGLDWPYYAGLYTDFVSTLPALHSVCLDHYESMLQLLELLQARGYRRPGVILEQGRDQRVQHRQTAAFRAFQAYRPEIECVPVLLTAGLVDFAKDFRPWFRKYRPDVVLSHIMETQDWITQLSPRGAHEIGFVLLNVLERRAPCAALDLQPRVLGGRAAEMLVGQILRGELGAPTWPSRTTIQAQWIEGPTVRPPVGSAAGLVACSMDWIDVSANACPIPVAAAFPPQR